MNYTDVLSLIGGLCLFLFGMQVMGNALEKRAGSGLRGFIGKLTTSRTKGFLTGLAVTAIIQSSSATTVMVVGFVNSGVMSLRQAINVIMGANVGTTVTAWLLSLAGISSSNPIVSLFKPSTFTPILALVGIILYMFCKSDKNKDLGTILLGFATLMFGMEAMSAAVSGLRDVPAFQNILLAFSNPVLGVLAGALLTAIIQSSSASIGILQALSSTGQVTIGTAIPIILGQNIGTCVTAMLSSIGANKNARRAAVVHLSFNIIGCMVCLTLFSLADSLFRFAFVSLSASTFSIALIHTIFNVTCTALMLPFTGYLERLAIRLIPDSKVAESKKSLLDERLLASPSFAIDRCREVSFSMAADAVAAFNASLEDLTAYSEKLSEQVRRQEQATDAYEDELGSYLVKLSAKPMSESNSNEANRILHLIGDFERIADHAVNIVESAEEIHNKDFVFSPQAKEELSVLCAAVSEIVQQSYAAYRDSNLQLAAAVEPLEQVIDELKSQIRSRHILRLQAGECSLDAGFVLSDLLTNLERVADHCSNIAGCLIEMTHSELDLHQYLEKTKQNNEDFQQMFRQMQAKYRLP